MTKRRHITLEKRMQLQQELADLLHSEADPLPAKEYPLDYFEVTIKRTRAREIKRETHRKLVEALHPPADIKPAADFLAPGAIEINRYQAEIYDLIKRNYGAGISKWQNSKS